jgi:hypothetical protein
MFLWEHNIDEVSRELCRCIIENSIHRLSEKRIKHLTNWIKKSYDPRNSFNFIKKNINHAEFFPFASPWNSGELDKIYKESNGSKLIRLSTRKAGVLTISSNIGINCHRRLYVETDGIHFGNFKFDNIHDLSVHLDNTECCICLEDIIKYNNTALRCGHILHNTCLTKHLENSLSIFKQCPVCKKNIYNTIVLPRGGICVYTQLNFIDQ